MYRRDGEEKSERKKRYFHLTHSLKAMHKFQSTTLFIYVECCCLIISWVAHIWIFSGC